MQLLQVSDMLNLIWFPILMISLGALIKLGFILIENKFKKKKKEKAIYNHIKMVDEQKEKYKQDKEKRIKEENLRRKKEFYKQEIRKI